LKKIMDKAEDHTKEPRFDLGEPSEQKSLLIDEGFVDSFELTKFENLPFWLQDNQWIRTGYRVNFSFKLCATSLFHKHNELLCIWTHLLGFVTFFILMFLTWFYFLDNPDAGDVIVFTVFLLGAQCQMLFSTIFHTFNCHSPDALKWLARLDYTGISLMIVGSYFPPLYYGFGCHNVERIVYLVLVSLFGVAGVCVSMFPVFATPRFRVVRTVFFIIFGWFAVFPMPHMAFLFGFALMWPLMWRELIMGITYVLGAVVYSTRVPERWWPGKFDGCGSHVIWHMFSNAAALMQFYVCLYVYYNRQDYAC